MLQIQTQRRGVDKIGSGGRGGGGDANLQILTMLWWRSELHTTDVHTGQIYTFLYGTLLTARLALHSLDSFSDLLIQIFWIWFWTSTIVHYVITRQNVILPVHLRRLALLQEHHYIQYLLLQNSRLLPSRWCWLQYLLFALRCVLMLSRYYRYR